MPLFTLVADVAYRGIFHIEAPDLESAEAKLREDAACQDLNPNGVCRSQVEVLDAAPLTEELIDTKVAPLPVQVEGWEESFV